MDNRQNNGLKGFGLVALLAVLVAIPCYYVTRMMVVSGPDNAQLGTSGAIFAGIAVVAALTGGAILWFGRHRATPNTKIALVGVIFTALILTLAAISLGGTQPTPAAPPSADI